MLILPFLLQQDLQQQALNLQVFLSSRGDFLWVGVGVVFGFLFLF